MVTMIDGEEAVWTPKIQELYDAKVGAWVAKGDRVLSANYFNPRPYVDEYNTGSNHAGFTWVSTSGGYGRKVFQVKWSEEPA
jgi:hypothetical protein